MKYTPLYIYFYGRIMISKRGNVKCIPAGLKKGDYYILNNSSVPGVLVECGFLSNNEERKKLTSDLYQRKVAKHLKKGVIDYFANF